MAIGYEDWLNMTYMDNHILVSDLLFEGVIGEKFYSVSARVFGVWTREMRWCYEDVRRIVSKGLYTGKGARESFHEACQYTIEHAGKQDLHRLETEF